MANIPVGGFSGIELWLVDLSAAALALEKLEAATPRLAEADERKIAASVGAAARRERRAAHIALRLLLERAFGPAWRCVPYDLAGTGKPVLNGAPGSFNLAHVDRFALIGLSATGPIGVDIEPARVINVTDERRGRIEKAAIALAGGAALPELAEARFLQAWVRLEACAKADGSGIGRLLTGVGIIGDLGVQEDRAKELASRFTVVDVPAGAGCHAAVALAPGETAPAPRTLPTTTQGLDALIVPARDPIRR